MTDINAVVTAVESFLRGYGGSAGETAIRAAVRAVDGFRLEIRVESGM